MPISDFLATAGRGTAVGQIAEAFGGRTRGQSTLDNFIDKDLPAFAEQFKRAQTLEEITAAERMFAPAALKAGVPFAGVEKLQDLLAKPALEGLRQGEYDKIISEYGPQKTPLTPMVAPEGQGQPLAPDTTFTPQETPGKPFDQQAALRLGKFGGIPAGLSGLLQTPAEVAMKETSQAKTQTEVDALKARQEGLKEYSNIPPPGAMVSPRQMARDYPQGLTQFQPQREKADDPLLPLRERLLESQINRTNRPDRPERPERQGSVEFQDFVAQGGNPNDRDAFLEYVDRRRGRGTETETEWKPDAIDDEVTLKQVAREADRFKNLPPEEQDKKIKELFAVKGYVAEGNLTVGKPPTKIPGAGWFTDPEIQGLTGFRRKSKVTTKKAGGAAPAAAKPGNKPSPEEVKAAKKRLGLE